MLPAPKLPTPEADQEVPAGIACEAVPETELTVLPLPSSTRAAIWVESTSPEAPPAGCVVITVAAAAPGVTVKAFEVPA